MLGDVKKTRRIVGIAALVLWLASLILPAATFATPGYEYVPGALVAEVGLVFGWIEFQIGAYGNLIFLPVVILMIIGRRPWTWLLVLIEITALWSFTWYNLPDDIHQNNIDHFAVGFYVWQLALLLPLACRIWERFSLRSSRSLQPQP